MKPLVRSGAVFHLLKGCWDSGRGSEGRIAVAVECMVWEDTLSSHPGRSHYGMRRHMPATLTLAIGLQMGEDDEEEEEVVVRGRQLCGWICCHGVVWPSTASAKPGMIEKKIRSRPWRKKVIRIHLPENA
jgi:hypothetical protein